MHARAMHTVQYTHLLIGKYKSVKLLHKFFLVFVHLVTRFDLEEKIDGFTGTGEIASDCTRIDLRKENTNPKLLHSMVHIKPKCVDNFFQHVLSFLLSLQSYQA